MAFLVAYRDVWVETFRVCCKRMSENNIMATNLTTLLLHTGKHKRAHTGHKYASERIAVGQHSTGERTDVRVCVVMSESIKV